MQTFDKRTYMSNRYAVQRAFFIELMGGKCKRCRSVDRLEIDHIDRKTKSMHIGKLFGKGQIIEAITELITKCQILCRKCHKEKTIEESKQKVQPLKHGTLYVWMNLRCSCEPCTRARWAWNDKRNAKRTPNEPYVKRRDPVFGQPIPDDVARPLRWKRKGTVAHVAEAV